MIAHDKSWYEPEEPGTIYCDSCLTEIRDAKYYEYDGGNYCISCVEKWKEDHLVEV